MNSLSSGAVNEPAIAEICYAVILVWRCVSATLIVVWYHNKSPRLCETARTQNLTKNPMLFTVALSHICRHLTSLYNPWVLNWTCELFSVAAGFTVACPYIATIRAQRFQGENCYMKRFGLRINSHRATLINLCWERSRWLKKPVFSAWGYSESCFQVTDLLRKNIACLKFVFSCLILLFWNLHKSWSKRLLAKPETEIRDLVWIPKLTFVFRLIVLRFRGPNFVSFFLFALLLINRRLLLCHPSQ